MAGEITVEPLPEVVEPPEPSDDDAEPEGAAAWTGQVGAFFGAWLAGVAFDATGSYAIIWLISIGLAVLAAVANLPIREAPLVRLAEVPAE